MTDDVSPDPDSSFAGFHLTTPLSLPDCRYVLSGRDSLTRHQSIFWRLGYAIHIEPAGGDTYELRMRLQWTWDFEITAEVLLRDGNGTTEIYGRVLTPPQIKLMLLVGGVMLVPAFFLADEPLTVVLFALGFLVAIGIVSMLMSIRAQRQFVIALCGALDATEVKREW